MGDDRVVAGVGRPLDRSARWVARRLPLVPVPAAGTVAARVRGFVAAVEHLAAAPRALAAVFALGAAGQVAVAGTLWAVATDVGVALSPATALVVVPVARVSGLSPTPGGAGSAVVLLSGLLVATTGASPAAATAAALAYRAVAFWLPTAVGGGVAAVVVGRPVRGL
ncbi:MAG: lysylphosphatidylglycerol synthase domain-containing protein [Haloferacaceae archaeon]